jgi:hypothetical protein
VFSFCLDCSVTVQLGKLASGSFSLKSVGGPVCASLSTGDLENLSVSALLLSDTEMGSICPSAVSARQWQGQSHSHLPSLGALALVASYSVLALMDHLAS